MFDSIDDFYREETSEILLICLEGIQPLSLLALWFYEQERVTPNYALRANKTPFARADVVAVFESIYKRLNARGQDLLVIEEDTMTVEDLMYTVRFSHPTVKDFLSTPDMLKKLHSWKSRNFDARMSLCKATLAIVKSINLPPLTDITDYVWTPVKTNHAGNPVINDYARVNRCLNYVSEFFSYAHSIEQDEGILDNTLIDGFQSVISSTLVQKGRRQGTYLGWVDQYDTRPLNNNRDKPQFPYDKEMTSFFFASAVEANLKQYVAHKLRLNPRLISLSFRQRPVLDRALRPPPWTKSTYRIDPDMIDLLLTRGANPNMILTLYKAASDSSFVYASEKAWTTVWALFLQRLHYAASAKICKPPELIQDEFEATMLMIEHGAAIDLRPWRILAPEDSLKHFSGPMLTPSDIFHEVFPPGDAIFLEQLLKNNRPWALRQACSWLGRTILLWFYRDIDVVVWSLTWLLAIFIDKRFGVIRPIVFITSSIYGLLLVWPAISFIVSGAAPIMLSALILSDWITILDWLVSCLIGATPGYVSVRPVSFTVNNLGRPDIISRNF